MKITNEIVHHKSISLGFDLVGFSNAEILTEEIENLNSWLDKGYQSDMSYMDRNIDKRQDVSLILEGSKSVISLGMNYFHEDEYFSAAIDKYCEMLEGDEVDEKFEEQLSTVIAPYFVATTPFYENLIMERKRSSKKPKKAHKKKSAAAAAPVA